MIYLFTIFTFHMNFWRVHENYILKITLCSFLKKIVILRLYQVAPYITYFGVTLTCTYFLEVGARVLLKVVTKGSIRGEKTLEV